VYQILLVVLIHNPQREKFILILFV